MKIGQSQNSQLFKNLQNITKVNGEKQNPQLNKESKTLQARNLNLGLAKTDFFKLYLKANKTKEENSLLNEARKNDPALDKMIYNADMAKLHEEQARAQNIAKKIAQGKKLSEEEREFIEKYDPELIKKAERAKGEGDRVRQALKNANSDLDRGIIASNAISQAYQIQKKGPDEVYGGLLLDAVTQAVMDYNKKRDKTEKLDSSTNPLDQLKDIIKKMEDEIENPQELEKFKENMGIIINEMMNEAGSSATFDEAVKGASGELNVKIDMLI